MAVIKEDKTFIELTGSSLPITSRLRMFNILKDTDGTRFTNIFRSFIVDNDIKDNDDYYTLHLAIVDEWWDNVSFRYYGAPDLWWVLCLMNNVINPFEDIEEGQQIKVLKEQYLYILFNDIGNLSEL
jgi:hypothetical protein